MKRVLCGWFVIALCSSWLDAIAAAPVSDRQKTVSGITINIGVVRATQAAGPGQTGAAVATQYASGGQHLVVILSDAKTGDRIGDAHVVVEIRDPRGNTERKTLVPAITAGVRDYSGVFRFDWSGKYKIRVSVTPHSSLKSVAAGFTYTHVI